MDAESFEWLCRATPQDLVHVLRWVSSMTCGDVAAAAEVDRRTVDYWVGGGNAYPENLKRLRGLVITADPTERDCMIRIIRNRLED